MGVAGHLCIEHVHCLWYVATPFHIFFVSRVLCNGQFFRYGKPLKESNKVDVVRQLIDHGADVAVRDETNLTPLHLAAFSGSVEVVQILIEHGANVAARDGRNVTPLHYASSTVSSVAALLSYHRVDGTDSTIAIGGNIFQRYRARRPGLCGY